ncbi:MAG: sulfurtransferase complex subunit TusB [Alphaproteobacteria bacterium]|nr:sulfurtransferase complex subunit TusB [Alphaproteobacteria bacterium]
MSTLHTVNKSPFERAALISALGHVRPGDALLMIEDAVVGARKRTAFAAVVEAAAKICALFVLAPDLAARGMAEKDLIEGIKTVDYGGFVDLAAKHRRVQSWL